MRKPFIVCAIAACAGVAAAMPPTPAARPTRCEPTPPAERPRAQTTVSTSAGSAFLSASWAATQAQTDAAAAAKAEALRAQGYELYKRKNDAAAVARYEAALALHASGRLYYDYANSLSNVDRLADSVRAYDIAIAIGYEHPEIALYNGACALSRMRDAEAAYARLGQAIARGYQAFGKIDRDPDLANLRARSDWTARYAELHPPLLAPLVGQLGFAEPRDDTVYTVCPDNRVIYSMSSPLDESCCGGVQRGQLLKKGDAIVIHWSELCGRRGVGGRKNRHDEYEGCQPYRSCSKVVCRALNTENRIMDASEIPVVAARARGEDDDGTAYHVPFEHGPPEACKPPKPKN